MATENKKEDLKLTENNGFNSNSWEWLIGLILIYDIFNDKTDIKTETRLAKLETKTEMLEKIILK